VFSSEKEGVNQQHLHTRNHCGLCYHPNIVILDVHGKDRRKLLHSVLANEVEGLKVGQGNLCHLLNPKGKVQAEMRLFQMPEAIRLVCEISQVKGIEKNIQMRIFRSDVQIQNRQDDFIFLGLHGPDAPDVLQTLQNSASQLETEYAHQVTSLSDEEVFLFREHHTGEIGFDLAIPKEKVQKIWQELLSSKKIRAISSIVLQALQMEAGVPVFGVDFTEDHMSVEVNLNKAVSNTKGCYLGQEPVARLLSRGHVAKRLVGFIVEGDQLPPAETEIWPLESGSPNKDGRSLGKITRALYSPTLHKNIALGFLKYDFLENRGKEKVSLQTAEGKDFGLAKIQKLPFYRNGKINWLEGGPKFKKVIAPQAKTKNKGQT
jgi:folate-binding protein YgfZ